MRRPRGLGRIRREFQDNPSYLLGHLVLLLLGLLLIASGLAVAVAIGPSIAAVGIVGYVTYLYAKREEGAQHQGRVLVSEYGFRGAFSRRGAAIPTEYDRQLEGARESIDILGFGLRALREDYEARFEEWARRAQVRILLIDPSFPSKEMSYAGQRDSEENTSSGSIEEDVQRFLEVTATLRATNGRFQVRLMRCLPSVNVFRVDGMMFWGPYLVGGPSRNLPTFLVAEPGRLFDVLMGHFDAIWSSSTLSEPTP